MIIATLPATATLPAVMADPATATLPAVMADPATATLPAVMADPATATLPAVMVEPATAMLPAVDRETTAAEELMVAIGPSQPTGTAVVGGIADRNAVFSDKPQLEALANHYACMTKPRSVGR